MKEFYYKIGEVAEILAIEQHTLRYLENTLKLKIKRNDRGDRLYSENDLDTLRLVLKLKNEKGLNTTAIKMALENIESSQESSLSAKTDNAPADLNYLRDITSKIAEQNEELLSQNQKLQDQINALEDKISNIDARREERIEKVIELWRNEQEERNKSWLSWLKRK